MFSICKNNGELTSWTNEVSWPSSSVPISAGSAVDMVPLTEDDLIEDKGRSLVSSLEEGTNGQGNERFPLLMMFLNL